MVTLPDSVTAILLLPSGHRACDDDATVPYPPSETLECWGGPMAGRYRLMGLHEAGSVDEHARALYVLGGRYRPGGGTRLQALPDEVYDQ